MANGVFNNARGKIGWYGSDTLGLTGNGGIVVVVLEAAEADDTLNNYTNLDTLLTQAGNTQWTASGYSRAVHAAADVTWSADNTANTAKLVIDTDDTWTSVTGNAAVKLLICYDPDTTSGDDTTIIPLTYHDFSVTPNGGNITANYDQTNGVWASS